MPSFPCCLSLIRQPRRTRPFQVRESSNQKPLLLQSTSAQHRPTDTGTHCCCLTVVFPTSKVGTQCVESRGCRITRTLGNAVLATVAPHPPVLCRHKGLTCCHHITLLKRHHPSPLLHRQRCLKVNGAVIPDYTGVGVFLCLNAASDCESWHQSICLLDLPSASHRRPKNRSWPSAANILQGPLLDSAELTVRKQTASLTISAQGMAIRPHNLSAKDMYCVSP